ncbi:PREDICTED: neuropeptides capa receptor-like [Priapulus caudatus]|uniref:Neuropeptides capa receptor-like n=1 Tax=Priapulus caudatus TaxID=37621 RepID=A0ABM1EER7_PRICU|nr:PREDICTED: neuropeptides capa receptor-like [Priapulus caudatus]
MEFVNNGTLAAASNATEPQTCNLTTMGEANFLECSLGLRYPLVTRTMPITVIYSVIFVTGIFGNVSTCVVIARNNHMHTATNCYLFSLACSDIMILLLGMPFDIYVTWEQYPWTFGTALCFMKGFLLEMTTNASILCITAFTVERYVAICHPIWAHTLSKISRAVKMITMIWLVACAVAIPHGYINEVNYLQDDAGKDISASSWCAVDFQSSDNAQRQLLLVLFAFFFFFLVPMSIIAVLYVRIGLVLSNSGLVRQNSDDKTPSNREARKAVIKMLETFASIGNLGTKIFKIAKSVMRQHTPALKAIATAAVLEQSQGNQSTAAHQL